MIARRFHTHSHLGDAVICTGAVRNVRAAHPEIPFVKPLQYAEVWNGNPDALDIDRGGFFLREIEGRLDYGPVSDERTGANGNCVEGFTQTLCRLLNLDPAPIVTRTPVLYVSDEEAAWARQFEDAILLNANCQTCTISKGYPHWQKVVDRLKGLRIIQIGGNCPKDISPDLRGVEDLRGKTSTRQLIALASSCRAVISPPSSITNIAAAFQKPQVVVNASREADALTDYPGTLHVSHVCKCCGWGVVNGCVSLGLTGGRTCAHRVARDGREFCQCQAETRPEAIVRAVYNVIGESKQ
ncbi:MAG: hypothetical protein J5746_13880 [Victivallales bacterium]|nr:hypothetical protein [Victivallales bacterium]